MTVSHQQLKFVIFFPFSIVEARAEIPGDSEKFLKPGSTLRLSCRVLQSMDTPLYLFWYHNNRMINYDLHRGVNVSTDPGKVNKL